MIRFDAPWLLLLALPWVSVWWGFARIQRRACRWIDDHVAARHRARLTLLGPRSLPWLTGLLLVLGLLLVVAAARPTRTGGTVRELTGRVVLLLDASASMRSTDVTISGASDDQRQDRFEVARVLGRELVDRLDGFQLALVSFSGTAATQLPMTSDRALQQEALRVVEVHNFYRYTGSSFGAALDRVLSFVEDDRGDLQAVLLSDGEQPFEESFDESLAAVEAQAVSVHTVAIGSDEGEPRVIYDFRDIVAKAKKPGVLREYTTRRVDEHLERIARITGGRFERTEGGDLAALADSLAQALRHGLEESESVRDEEREDLSVLLLAAVLIGFLIEALIPWRSANRSTRFELQRLGARRRKGRAATARLLLLLLTGSSLIGGLLLAACAGDDPAIRANIENENGIQADRILLHPKARTHYERSLAYDVRPEIPTYNLARSVFLQHDYSEAHELYQEALEIAPELPEIHYNDGHALYRWGVYERDPQGCFLDRTYELWKAARDRFAAAKTLYDRVDGPGSAGSRRSQLNVEFMDERLDAVSKLMAEPPPGCRELPPGQPLGTNQGGGGETQGLAEGASQGGEPQLETQLPKPGENQNEPGPMPNGSPEESPEPGEEGGSESGRRASGPGSAGAEGTSDQGDPRPETGPDPLTPDQEAQIAEALERLREQGHEGAKFHRRTRAEQFPSESWKNPKREIWW